MYNFESTHNYYNIVYVKLCIECGEQDLFYYNFRTMKKYPLVVLFLTIFIGLLGFGIIIPILPTYSKELGASNFETGMLASVYSLMTFLFAPLWGTLSDRIGRRPVIIYSIIITGLAYVMFSFADSLLILMLSRILAGIGSANISAAQAYIADITTPVNRVKNMGMIGAAFGLGFTFGPPVGGFLKSAYGVEMVGYVTAILCFINLIMAYFLLPESLKEKNRLKKYSFRPVRDLVHELKKPVIRELFTINFIFTVTFFMFQITSTLLWKERFGLTEKEIGYLFMYLGLLSAIIQGGLVGRLNKIFGEQKLLLAGNAFMAAGMLLLPFATKELFIVFNMIAIACIAVSNGCLTPGISSMLSQVADKKEQGQVLSMNQSFSSLGRVIGPALGGLLYGLNFHSPYIVGSFLMIIAFVIAGVLAKQKIKNIT